MKNILLSILIIQSLFSYGQEQVVTEGKDFSIINFVPFPMKIANGKSMIYTIGLGNRVIGTIAYNENLQYKIYSEGRATVIAGGAFLLDIKKGSTYWIELNPRSGNYGVTNEKAGLKLFKKNVNTLYVEEDRNK
jgi:hypothetical protein